VPVAELRGRCLGSHRAGAARAGGMGHGAGAARQDGAGGRAAAVGILRKPMLSGSPSGSISPSRTVPTRLRVVRGGWCPSSLADVGVCCRAARRRAWQGPRRWRLSGRGRWCGAARVAAPAWWWLAVPWSVSVLDAGRGGIGGQASIPRCW